MATQPTLEVVSATDLHPRYLDCVPTFIEAWRIAASDLGVEVRPRIFIIAAHLPSQLSAYERYCEVVPPGTTPTGFLAQVVRIFAGAISDAESVMTTDIDMLPLDQRVTRLAMRRLGTSSHRIVIIRDVLPAGQYPMCYTLASPGAWKVIADHLARPGPIGSRVAELFESRKIAYSGEHGGVGWFTDQECLYESIQESSDSIEVVRLTDRQTGHRRLDRGRHRSPRHWIVVPLLLFGWFTDYHVHHPLLSNRRYVSLVMRINRARVRVRQIFGGECCGRRLENMGSGL